MNMSKRLAGSSFLHVLVCWLVIGRNVKMSIGALGSCDEPSHDFLTFCLLKLREKKIKKADSVIRKKMSNLNYKPVTFHTNLCLLSSDHHNPVRLSSSSSH